MRACVPGRGTGRRRCVAREREIVIQKACATAGAGGLRDADTCMLLSARWLWASRTLRVFVWSQQRRGQDTGARRHNQVSSVVPRYSLSGRSSKIAGQNERPRPFRAGAYPHPTAEIVWSVAARVDVSAGPGDEGRGGSAELA